MLAGQPYFCEAQEVIVTMMANRTKAMIDLFFILGGFMIYNGK